MCFFNRLLNGEWESEWLGSIAKISGSQLLNMYQADSPEINAAMFINKCEFVAIYGYEFVTWITVIPLFFFEMVSSKVECCHEDTCKFRCVCVYVIQRYV